MLPEPTRNQCKQKTYVHRREVSEVKLGQVEAYELKVYHGPRPPHPQLPTEPEASEPSSSFNLCIFSYMPKDSVTMGHVFLVKSPLSCVLVLSAVSYKIDSINMVDFIDRKP